MWVGVFLEHNSEEGRAGGEDQLGSSNHVPVAHLHKTQCFSSGDELGLFYDNTLMPLFLRPPSQTLLCYYVSEWQSLSNPSLDSITSLQVSVHQYSIAHWLGISRLSVSITRVQSLAVALLDVVITKSRSECYLRSGVITASLLFITLAVL